LPGAACGYSLGRSGRQRGSNTVFATPVAATHEVVSNRVNSSRHHLLALATVLGVAAGALFLPVPPPVASVRLTVAAASGSEGLVRDLAAEALGGGGRDVLIQTGASVALARRIARGFRPDVFIASGEKAIELLAEAGRLAPDPPIPLMEARLVVVIPDAVAAPDHQAEHLLSPAVRTIAVGAPDTELGRVTRSALSALGIWFDLLPRLRPAPTAEIALQRVRRGLCDAAVVFGPDAAGAGGVRVLERAFPPGTHPLVRFQAVRLRNGHAAHAARRFFEYLSTPEAAARVTAWAQGRRLARTPDRWARLAVPVLLSARAACVAILLVIPIALLVAAYLARRPRSLARTAVATLVTAPLVLPPVAVGCGLLLLLADGGPVERLTGLDLAFTWEAGALAAAAVALPLAVRPMRRAFRSVDRRYLRAASSLGSSAPGTFLAVVLPLSARGVVTGALLAFGRAFGEFGATLVVAGSIPQLSRTLPLAIFDETESGDPGFAAVLLLAAVGIALLCTLAAVRIEAGSSRS
jgi:molybdate transport system permease protein